MATLVRWDPFREIAQLQNDLGRLFSGNLGNGHGNGSDSRTWVPALDVWETDEELVYSFDLPGVPQDKIAIEFDDGALTVSAERERTEEVKQDRFYRFERRHGTFARSIGLPPGATEDSISADYKDGVLEVHVQKPKAPEPRRISIGSTPSESVTIEGKAAQSVTETQ